MRTILTVVFVFSVLVVNSQTLNYKIVWKGDSVGYMTVSQSDSAGYKVYNLESLAAFWMFGEKRILTRITSTFKDGALMEARTTMHRNEVLRESSSTRWTGERYEIIRDGKERPSPERIEHSIASAYFRIPEGEVYSERFGQMLPVSIEDDEAVVTKPNGYDNVYAYGTYCNYVEVDNTLVKLYIVRLSGSSKDISNPG